MNAMKTEKKKKRKKDIHTNERYKKSITLQIYKIQCSMTVNKNKNKKAFNSYQTFKN